MSMSVDYRRLSLNERIQLVQDIWDSIADESEGSGVPPWQQQWLDRRLEDVEKTPHDVMSWEDARKELPCRDHTVVRDHCPERMPPGGNCGQSAVNGDG